MSSNLDRARSYEGKVGKQIPDGQKCVFHLTPEVGWMNDPNGFSLYRGEYHLFYQYHPYSSVWGPMHWGHQKTRDFIKWEQLPCALAPDTEYDGQGCFSGSAVEHEGKHILMYTGVLDRVEADGSHTIRQTQCIAVGDGVNYEKLSANPVITADALPEGSSGEDFRDPRIWKEGNTFYTAVGSLGSDGSGQIALFSSQDAEEWRFESILDTNGKRYGKMWECPDFFPLDGKQVLIVSPQFMRAEGLEFHNGNNSIYFVGTYDREKRSFLRGEARSVDCGLDFYAPQTVETEDGRRVMVGWLQSWDNYMTPEDFLWSGMMTIPRELEIREGRLIQNPVRELENYRQKEVSCKGIRLSEQQGSLELDGIRGRVLDMIVEADVSRSASFTIHLAVGEGCETTISYEKEKGTFTTDRTCSGLKKDLLCTRSMYVDTKEGKLKLRLLLDKYTVELFVNDGEQAMTSLIYTPLEAEGISFSCKGETVLDITKYEIVLS